MGKRYFNSVRLKSIPNGQTNSTYHVGNPVFGVPDPDAQFQIHRTVAKIFQLTHRAVIFQNTTYSLGGLNHQVHSLVNIRIVGNSHTDFKSDQTVAERPIDHLLGDQVFVGNQVLEPVPLLQQIHTGLPETESSRNCRRPQSRHPA